VLPKFLSSATCVSRRFLHSGYSGCNRTCTDEPIFRLSLDPTVEFKFIELRDYRFAG
jgi:hypothetical protein